MKIVLDMDEVICNTVEPWIALYNKEHSDNVSIDDIKTWKLQDTITKCSNEKLDSYINQPGFFRNLKPVKNSQKSIKSLIKNGHDVIIATATPRGSITGCYEKQQWIYEYLPFFNIKNFVSIKRKGLIQADLILDDAIHNCINFNGIAVIMNKPWNTKFDADFRVKNWKEFIKLIDDINKDYLF